MGEKYLVSKSLEINFNVCYNNGLKFMYPDHDITIKEIFRQK